MTKARVASLGDVAEGSKVRVDVGDRAILLARVGGRVCAIDAVCSHSEGPLEEGEIQGTNVVCPLHEAIFDLTTGKASPETPWATDLACYRTSIEGDEVYVELRSERDTTDDESPPARLRVLDDPVAEGPPPEALQIPEHNPLDPAQLEDPTPIFHRALAEKPVCYSPTFGIWLVTRYDDVWTVLKHPELFSSGASTSVREEIPDEVAAVMAEGFPIVNTLVTNDPPSHARFRGLVNKAFTPRRVMEREPRVRQVANELVDAFVDRGRADLVWELAYPLPMRMIAEVLGVPNEEIDRFKRWSDHLVENLSANLTVERRVECTRSLVEFQHYFAAQIEERRTAPRDDMLTDLLNARIGGEKPLDVPEMLSMLQQILVAGNETTTNMIGSMMARLLLEPELLEAIRGNRKLAVVAVEETLRLEAPVQGLFRVATRDVELGGVPIPKGAQLQVLYAAGNRDPAEFEDPDRFDLGRKNATSHIAFGGGIHFCLGAALARLEGKIAVETLIDRLPGLRRAGGENLEHVPHFFLRGLRHLNVEWDVA